MTEQFSDRKSVRITDLDRLVTELSFIMMKTLQINVQ